MPKYNITITYWSKWENGCMVFSGDALLRELYVEGEDNLILGKEEYGGAYLIFIISATAWSYYLISVGLTIFVAALSRPGKSIRRGHLGCFVFTLLLILLIRVNSLYLVMPKWSSLFRGSMSMEKGMEYVWLELATYTICGITSTLGMISASREIRKWVIIKDAQERGALKNQYAGGSPDKGKCKFCGADNPEGAVFCTQCGARLRENGSNGK
ncbi:MAG: zinc ribbon domain-containing protein [Candidatus Korarchaeota archaeon]